MTERDDRTSGATGTAEIPLLADAWEEQNIAERGPEVTESPDEPNVVADLSEEPISQETAGPAYTPEYEHAATSQPYPASAGRESYSSSAARESYAPPAATPPLPTPPPNATVPVTVRPTPRLPRRGPLTLMGPWAPAAGGGLGLVVGLVIVLVIGGSAVGFSHRLALAFVVLGLGMLGTAVILLADEVQLLRRRARDAVVRPQWVEATADLLNGLTPARLLLMSSGFVLFLAALLGR